MRVLTLLLAAASLAATSAPASAQLFKGKASCTSVYKRCVNYSAGYGPQEVKACEAQREACMKTGEWKSRAFEYKDLVKQ
jgi:hypothetical protein